MAEQEQTERPATVVGGISLSEPERQRAYVAALQRDLNRHRRQLGAPERLAVDGKWDEHTEQAFREVCRVLGVAPVRNVRTFRLIAGAAEALTDAERALGANEGAAFEKQLRERFASERAQVPEAVLEEARPPGPDVDDDFLDDDELIDLDDDELIDLEGGPPPSDVVVSVRFDPASWRMLQHLAARQHVAVGAALGSAIQRAAYLQRVAADGGELMVKRGRRVYRLRPPGRR